MENKILVAYFSACGTTEKTAKLVAQAANADLFQIQPAVPYTSADLDWRDAKSRSTLEMKDEKSRPAMQGKVENMAQYTTVLVGFPIWWYKAPTIINTFLEAYDFADKTVILFATSGGSAMGDTLVHLKLSCAETTHWEQGPVLSDASADAVAQWVNTLHL